MVLCSTLLGILVFTVYKAHTHTQSAFVRIECWRIFQKIETTNEWKFSLKTVVYSSYRIFLWISDRLNPLNNNYIFESGNPLKGSCKLFGLSLDKFEREKNNISNSEKYRLPPSKYDKSLFEQKKWKRTIKIYLRLKFTTHLLCRART